MNSAEELRQEAEIWKQRLASEVKNLPLPWNPTAADRARIDYLQQQTRRAVRRYQECLR